MTTKILRINEIAKDKPKEVFTSIYHLINEELLIKCFNELNGKKATGLDKVTKEIYEENLIENIYTLNEKLKNKKFKPSPARIVKIPKANGKLRQLAIANFEDKIVQLAVKKIVEAIFEPKFSNSMFGFRINRGCHDALRKVKYDIEIKPTSYVVEADIKGYFDNINHDKLIKCIEMHIKDTNLIRLIRKFLKAGVVENKRYYVNDKGTPQGSILSPVLANIYMYYILIKWFETFVKSKCRGFASIINYADDFICCFQFKNEAELFYKKWLPNRLNQGNLELSEDKTRLIEFGRFADIECKKRGLSKPETFDFLGFTHYCSKSRKGKFKVKLKTSRKKYRIALINFNSWLKQNRELPLYIIMEKLKEKLIGYYNYYGVTDNLRMVSKYYNEIQRILFKWLNRRSQRKSYNIEQFNQMIKMMKLPQPRIKINIYAIS